MLQNFKKFDKLLRKQFNFFCKENRRVRVILEQFLRMLKFFNIDLIRFKNILRKY